MRLIPLLAASGDTVVGLIRNPDHAEEVRAAGAEPFPCDLERESVEEIAAAITACDAVVFAAGAGSGSGPERKWAMDRDGAVKLLAAAAQADVPRYLIVSSAGAENPPQGDEVFSVYLRAKAEADAAVQGSDRQWTIVRPGRLTDHPGTGRVRIEAFPFQGSVTREDVAAVLAALLPEPRAAGRVLYLNGGEESIEAAVEAALG
jgi:nucleoside-diphosphate-sugar epimerase